MSSHVRADALLLIFSAIVINAKETQTWNIVN